MLLNMRFADMMSSFERQADHRWVPFHLYWLHSRALTYVSRPRHLPVLIPWKDCVDTHHILLTSVRNNYVRVRGHWNVVNWYCRLEFGWTYSTEYMRSLRITVSNVFIRLIACRDMVCWLNRNWDVETGRQFSYTTGWNPSDVQWKTYTCILGFPVSDETIIR
jgi:hypothetical protein